MEYVPWFAWIPIAGIICWGAISIAREIGGRRRLVQVLDDQASSNRALLDTLGSINSRLDAIEKTLTDIP
jgi:hypothetical protein